MFCGILCLPLSHVVVLITICNFQVWTWCTNFTAHSWNLLYLSCVFLGKVAFMMQKICMMFCSIFSCFWCAQLINISIMKTILVLLCILGMMVTFNKNYPMHSTYNYYKYLSYYVNVQLHEIQIRWEGYFIYI